MLREPYEYNATLGHFANSAPDRANVWYAMIDHPRFGAIRYAATQSGFLHDKSLVRTLADAFQTYDPTEYKHPRCLIALKDLKSGAELFVDNTEGFEETGYGKGSSGTGGEPMHQDPLMNIISGQWGTNYSYPMPYRQCKTPLTYDIPK